MGSRTVSGRFLARLQNFCYRFEKRFIAQGKVVIGRSFHDQRVCEKKKQSYHSATHIKS